MINFSGNTGLPAPNVGATPRGCPDLPRGCPDLSHDCLDEFLSLPGIEKVGCALHTVCLEFTPGVCLLALEFTPENHSLGL